MKFGINFFGKTHFSTNTFLILHPNKQPTKCVSKRAMITRQGETSFLNSRMPKKNSCLRKYNQINQGASSSTIFYRPLYFLTIANYCSLLYYLSPQVGFKMPRKLRSPFFRSESYAYVYRAYEFKPRVSLWRGGFF